MGNDILNIMRLPQSNQLPLTFEIGQITTLESNQPATATLESNNDGKYKLHLSLPRGFAGAAGASLDWGKIVAIGQQRRSDNLNNGFFPTAWINGFAKGNEYSVPEDGMVRVAYYADQGSNIAASGFDFFRGSTWISNWQMQQNQWRTLWIPVCKGDKFYCKIWSNGTQTFKFYEAWADFIPFKRAAG